MKEHNTKTLQMYTYAPSLLVFVVIIGFMLDSFFPTQYFFATWTQYIGMGLIFTGTLIVVWAMNSLKIIRRRIKKHEGIHLYTGAYRYDRHPDYVGYVCISFGFGFLLQSTIILILAALFVFVLRTIMDKKETHLVNDDSPMRGHYIEYKKKVKRFF